MTDDLQNIEAEIRRVLVRLSATIALNHEGREGSYEDTRREDDLDVAVVVQELTQLCSSRELAAAIKELEWVRDKGGHWGERLEERLAALKKKEKQCS